MNEYMRGEMCGIMQKKVNYIETFSYDSDVMT